MDGKYTNKSAPKPPRCHSCARPMQLLRRTSRFGGLPDLYSFYCVACKAYKLRQQLVENPGSVDCPGFFYVAVNAFFLAQQTFPRCVPQQPHCSFIRIPGRAMDGADDIVSD